HAGNIVNQDAVDQRQLIGALQSGEVPGMEGLTPLMQQGVIDVATARQMIGKSVSDTMNDQRLTRKATKDLSELARLYDNGTLTAKQFEDAIAHAEKEYGQGIMQRVPGY